MNQTILRIVYILFSCFWCTFCQEVTTDETLLTLSTGQIRGKTIITSKNHTGLVFLGVPFADPPTEEFRFEPPRQRSPWRGILNCTVFGPACMQNHTLFGTEPMSEDCLTLNVITYPSVCNTKTPCPVLVLYQGGAWYFDSQNHFPLDELIDRWATKGLVVVAAAYRMGALGFWNTGTDDVLGNYALYDMLESLRWVQKEIQNFAGDRNKVTILGYSSSADAVSQLTLSPLSQGLFHRIIPMSGTAFQLPLQDYNNVNKQLAIQVGCANDSSWENGKFKAVVQCMKANPVHQIMAAQKTLEDAKPSLMYHGPRIDGNLFTASVQDMAAKRRPFQMLIGTTLYEIGIPVLAKLVPKLHATALLDSCQEFVQLAGLTHPKVISLLCAKQYTPNADSDYGSSLTRLMDDVETFGPTYADARSMVEARAAVFLYSFDYVKKGLEGLSPFHAFDVFLIFRLHQDVQGQGYDSRDEEITGVDIDLFSNFIKYGTPTPKGTKYEVWNKLKSAGDYNYYKINLPEPKNEQFYHYEAVNFWENTVPKVEDALDKRKSIKVALALKNSNVEISTPTEAAHWKIAFWAVLAVGAAFLLTVVGISAKMCVQAVKNKKTVFEKYLDREEKRMLLESYANSLKKYTNNHP